MGKTTEALRMALEALETELSIDWGNPDEFDTSAEKMYEAIAAIKEALAQTQEPWCMKMNGCKTKCEDCPVEVAQPEQESVAWLLTDKNINALQVKSIQRLIDRLKYAHHTDLCVRINGQDEWFQADWLKHMVRVTPPQRTWEGLSVFEINDLVESTENEDYQDLVERTEAKLKDKNS